MGNLRGYNPDDHDDPQEFGPLPEGSYSVVIESSELKPTKKGDGSGFNFKLQVVDGEYKSRTVFWWLNYTSSSETAQRIGRSELKALCKACGVPNPADTIELHNIPFTAHLKVTPAKGEYGPGNKVAKVETLNSSASAPSMKSAKEGGAPWKQ